MFVTIWKAMRICQVTADRLRRQSMRAAKGMFRPCFKCSEGHKKSSWTCLPRKFWPHPQWATLSPLGIQPSSMRPSRRVKFRPDVASSCSGPSRPWTCSIGRSFLEEGAYVIYKASKKRLDSIFNYVPSLEKLLHNQSAPGVAVSYCVVLRDRDSQKSVLKYLSNFLLRSAQFSLRGASASSQTCSSLEKRINLTYILLLWKEAGEFSRRWQGQKSWQDEWRRSGSIYGSWHTNAAEPLINWLNWLFNG